MGLSWGEHLAQQYKPQVAPWTQGYRKKENSSTIATVKIESNDKNHTQAQTLK